MRLSSRNFYGSKKFDLQMINMIDVVFLILIFFLTTSSIVQSEKQVPAAIQNHKQSTDVSSTNLEPALIELTMDGENVVFRCGAVVTNDRKEIQDLLDGFVDKSAGAFVRAADDVPFDAPAKIIADCRKSGFKSVTYIPDPPDIGTRSGRE
jgi:biopolymer transport protein ExbD